MNDHVRLLSGLFALVPYAAVAWLYLELANGGFWTALGVILAVRFFFFIIETLNGVLAWHVYGKRIATGELLQFLRTNKFPKRRYSHDDFLSHMIRVMDEPESPMALRMAAKQIYTCLEVWERSGILLGMRMHSASDAALELYSPKAEAPVYGDSGHAQR